LKLGKKSSKKTHVGQKRNGEMVFNDDSQILNLKISPAVLTILSFLAIDSFRTSGTFV
jgi:hypothetical protein